MYCTECGAKNESGAAFCVNCGKKLKEEDTKERFCVNCGAKLNPGADVCLKCGKQVKSDEEKNPSYSNNYQKNNDINEYNLPDKYKPISMWGYFGYEILFLIPLIGTILLIVFALGGTQNVNLRNFAKSYFCLIIIILVLAAILITTMGAAIGTSSAWY